MTVENGSIEHLRVNWVSHGYGYGGDLMYFGEIFAHFLALAPAMSVIVDRKANFENPYNLPLRPLMRLFSIPLKRRAEGGQIYDTEIRLPSPGLLARLIRLPTDVYIAIEFTPASLLAVAAAATRKGKPLVLLVESDPAGRGGSTSPAIRAVKRWAVRRAAIVQTNSAKGRDYLVGQLGADPAKVRVAPYLTSRPPGPASTIADSGGPVRMLFANSISPRKGLRQLLTALAALTPADRARIDLTIVGDGPERAELEAVAAALGMGGRLRFEGRKRYAELGEYYARSDVLLVPSLADYRSLASFEGLAYGLALLNSTRDGATDETVREGVNGFAIDPHDPSQIADRISRLVNDRALLLSMRKASASLYEARFSLERIAANLAESVRLAHACK
ncbi:glycosyltransferase family 4 protein [Allopontixanthobacter sp.]|uniref:glycosyltransferase family 4 protein n=1 Tax=Allopontixanthobacter sp. TaxID=2906452 RepID=UPI002ABC7173|nr:glycosyltransferase family 4 protein [Allopontixanthobacter sp.]MDZ4307489.1 glycosyltransferase family 4 protein [Allopontixanthobacter sp.]